MYFFIRYTFNKYLYLDYGVDLMHNYFIISGMFMKLCYEHSFFQFIKYDIQYSNFFLIRYWRIFISTSFKQIPAVFL